MADTVNIKWTKDIDGNLVSPRSLMDGIQDTDGTTLKRYISTSATTDGILTLEEYNALSETEKMSGRVFCVESDGDAWNAKNIAYTDDLTVADKLDTIGTTDISSIGDGKITGAISELNDTLSKTNKFETISAESVAKVTSAWSARNAYTVSEDGVYLFVVHIRLANNTTSFVGIGINKSTDLQDRIIGTTDGYINRTISYIKECTTGDILNIGAYNNAIDSCWGEVVRLS